MSVESLRCVLKRTSEANRETKASGAAWEEGARSLHGAMQMDSDQGPTGVVGDEKSTGS